MQYKEDRSITLYYPQVAFHGKKKKACTFIGIKKQSKPEWYRALCNYYSQKKKRKLIRWSEVQKFIKQVVPSQTVYTAQGVLEERYWVREGIQIDMTKPIPQWPQVKKKIKRDLTQGNGTRSSFTHRPKNLSFAASPICSDARGVRKKHDIPLLSTDWMNRFLRTLKPLVPLVRVSQKYVNQDRILLKQREKRREAKGWLNEIRQVEDKYRKSVVRIVG